MADLTHHQFPSDLAAVRNRARQHTLKHGYRSHTESTSTDLTKFANLVEEALLGCRHGQNRLATQLLPLLRAVSFRELRTRGMALARAAQLAQDVANDVFVELLKDDSRVLRSWKPASARHDPRAFFGIIARRRAIDAFRRDLRLVTSDDAAAYELSTGDPSIEISMTVRECLRRTVGRCRDVGATEMMIYDALVANARQAEIASDLGVTADSVYQRTSRFRRDFVAVWNQE